MQNNDTEVAAITEELMQRFFDYIQSKTHVLDPQSQGKAVSVVLNALGNVVASMVVATDDPQAVGAWFTENMARTIAMKMQITKQDGEREH